MKPTMPKPSDGYDSGRRAMPHVMALNKDPTIGLKNNRQPPPRVSNVTAFAKGGAVKKDCAKPMKKAAGGKVQKPAHFAAGGAARVRKGQADQKGNPKPPLKPANLSGGK